MTTSTLHADSTAPANRVVQGVGSTDVDNSKNLINSDKAVSIGEDMKYSNCMVAICEKQFNMVLNRDVNEHDIKDIDLDSEDDPPCPCYTMQS